MWLYSFQAIIEKDKLCSLTKEVDPNEVLDEEVENLLIKIADDFVESTILTACYLVRDSLHVGLKLFYNL